MGHGPSIVNTVTTFLSRGARSVYHRARRNAVAADLAYWAARYTEPARARLHHLMVRLNPVTPEDLYPHRHLAASAWLQVAVTNICNARCSFCAYPKAIDSRTLRVGTMAFEVFKKAIDEWIAIGGDNIDITPVVGDTLVDPALLEKLDYAINHAKIKRVQLITNGILLNRHDLYKRLVDLNVHTIGISTQGTSREAYAKVFGVDKYQEVLSGMRNLFAYNRSKGEPVHIAIYFRHAQRPSEILRSDDFRNHIKPYLSRRVQFFFTSDYDNWGGTISEDDMSGVMRLRRPLPVLNVPCAQLFGYVVQHDGSVRLCGCRFSRTDQDDMVVGTIKEQTLEQIAAGERAWRIINGFYSGVRPETCAGCTLYAPIDQKWIRHSAARVDRRR